MRHRKHRKGRGRSRRRNSLAVLVNPGRLARKHRRRRNKGASMKHRHRKGRRHNRRRRRRNPGLFGMLANPRRRKHRRHNRKHRRRRNAAPMRAPKGYKHRKHRRQVASHYRWVNARKRRHHHRRNPSLSGVLDSIMRPLKDHAIGMAAAAALDLLVVNEQLDSIDMFRSSPIAKAGAKIIGYPVVMGLLGHFLPGKFGSIARDAGLFGMAFGVKSLVANFLKPGSPAALGGLAEIGYLGPGSMGYLGPQGMNRMGYLGPQMNGISGIGGSVGAMADAVSGY